MSARESGRDGTIRVVRTRMTNGLPSLWPLVMAAAPTLAEPADDARPGAPLRFEVRLARPIAPRGGRLIVVLGRSARPEPRFLLGRTGMDAAPAIARDVADLAA